MIRLGLFLSFLLLTQCASQALTIEDQDRSLGEIKRAVLSALPGGKRRISQNGREFYSQYFVPAGKRYGKLAKKNIRYMTKVTILGDRRPYTIEVLTSAYKVKNSSEGRTIGARDLGPDQGLTRMVFRRIQSSLSKSREDVNIIDDFRVF